MNVSSALFLTAVLVSAPLATACKKPLDPPPAPPPTITQSTFDPVYRASKALQGATTAGVSYVQFGELMQDLSTEIGIAKDHQMNNLDKGLIGLYDEAFATYNFSAALWKAQIDTPKEMVGGDIIVEVDGVETEPGGIARLEKYGIPVRERGVKYMKNRVKVVSPDAIQVVWGAANELLRRATEMYYGRTSAEGQATAKQ